MNLKVIDGNFVISKIKEVETSLVANEFSFLSNTDQEISLVCKEQFLPQNTVSEEKDYRLIRIEGVLDFSLVGILAKITNILSDENISIFVISTFNTDYFLIKNNKFEEVIELLTFKGYYFTED